MVGIDEQRPDRAVARVGGGEAQDPAVLLPHPDAGILLEPLVVRNGHAAGIAQDVFRHAVADLADSRMVLGTGAPYPTGHGHSLSSHASILPLPLTSIAPRGSNTN